MAKDFNSKFTAGDRIAYAAKFLKDTGQQTGGAGSRRGTFIGRDASMPDTYARVRWDDFEACVTIGAGQYADPEWVEDCRTNGSMVHAGNIAKVGSARFACNDLAA